MWPRAGMCYSLPGVGRWGAVGEGRFQEDAWTRAVEVAMWSEVNKLPISQLKSWKRRVLEDIKSLKGCLFVGLRMLFLWCWCGFSN